MRTACAALLLAIAGAGAPLSAQEHLKLAIGARGNWETAASELGQNAGIFKQHGLVLDLLYTQGSGETQQAVISGSADIGIGLGTTSVMAAFARGAPLKVIGNASTGSSEFWYVPAGSSVHSMKDAGGKTIAYSTAGSSSHIEVLGFIKHYAVDAKPVATGGTAATFTQVMSGQIDIGWSSPPFGLEAARDGKIRIVAYGRDLPSMRDQTIRVIAANAQFLRQRGEVAARFMQAYRAAITWMYSDPAALNAYAAFAGVAPGTAQQVRDDFYPREGLDPDRISGLDAVMADGVSFKYLSAPLSKEQLAQLFQIAPARN
ncbi:MAG: ABC transporter substrate-binding protein [Xanthobacteraceae bacterium]